MADHLDEPRQRRPGFWIAVGLGAFVLIALGIALGAGFGRDARQPSNNPTDGARVDMTTELPYLDGSGTFDFSELEGKVVVFNFWASYCIPCRAEHGELTNTFAAYRDRGVQFVGIVYHDEPSAARSFLDQFGWGDGYIYVDDPDGRVTVDFGVFGVPETFIVNADGIIVEKHFGEVDRNDLIPTLDAILAGGSPG